MQSMFRTFSSVVFSAAMLLFAFNCAAQQPKVFAPHKQVDPKDPPSKVVCVRGTHLAREKQA